MRHARAAQDARRQQLVVCRDECGRRIEQHDPADRELLELLRSALDAVELVADVEPPQRDVSRLKGSKRIARRQHGCRQTERGCGAGERIVRVARPMGDDGELHGSNAARRGLARGRRSGEALG